MQSVPLEAPKVDQFDSTDRCSCSLVAKNIKRPARRNFEDRRQSEIRKNLCNPSPLRHFSGEVKMALKTNR